MFRLFSFIFITIALVGMRVESSTMKVGGTSEPHPPNSQVQKIIDSIKPQVEEELGRTLSTFTLLAYKTQVVAGVNYFAKVDIGEENVVHLRVYHKLDNTAELTRMQYPKQRNHTIEFF